MSVDIAEIDEQHRKLIGLLNEFYDATNNGRGMKIAAALFDQLFDYAALHFATEERLMEEHGFPALEIHLMEHRKFVERVKALKMNFKKNKTDKYTLPNDVLTFLWEWLQTHILKTDKQYGSYLNKKGVT
jgi:hemerythrin